MKKLLALVCVLALSVGLVACAKKDDGQTANPIEDMALSDIMNDILTDVADLPAGETMELTAETFANYAFIEQADGMTGVANESMIGAIAHSVVLVRAADAEKAAAAAQEMTDNANPRKWICVEAGKTTVRQYGNTVLLVMSAEQTVNQILTNFDALNGAETPAGDVYDPNAAPSQPEGDVGGMLPEGEMPVAPLPGEQPVVGLDDLVETPAVTPTVTPEPAPVDTPTPAPAEKPAQKPADKPAEKPAEKPADKPVEKPVEKPADKPADKPAATDLNGTMESILANVADLPKTMTAELTKETFQNFAFIPHAEGYRGVVSEALIGSLAHSVVLVEVPEGTDAATVAADIKANANPRKWICVEAEKMETAVKGQMILLVMSFTDTADAILSNFNAL